MKELSIEEKAKRYDELFVKASRIYNKENDVLIIHTIEDIFPELKESEDKKMRRWIINYLDNKALNSGIIQEKTNIKNAIAWLEKQGTPAKLSEEEQNRFAKGVLTSCALSFIDYLDEQKYEGKMCVSNGECEDIENAFHNAMWDRLHRYYCKYIEKQGEQKPDKVEPKFRKGDWVVYCNDDVDLITGVEENGYCINNSGYIPFICESDVRLWTIQDAKDGDILAVENMIFIFKTVLASHIVSYCKLFNNKFERFSDGRTCCEGNSKVHPATKEQRDALMKEMTDAGYTFDFEKKELKKVEQKPAWGEEDIELLDNTIKFIEDRVAATSPSLRTYSPTLTGKEIPFLKALKDRVQPKQEWSKEDEQMLNDIIKDLVHPWNEYIPDRIEDEIIWLKNRLKSLRPQSTWKPSGEQMEALHYVANFDYGGHKATLVSLYEQLKKLKD